MKLIYAKLWLKKFIKYNHEKEPSILQRDLNRNVITLSHRVFKSRGERGHSIRQDIRLKLHKFIQAELPNYNKYWKIKSPNSGYLGAPSLLDILKKYLKRFRFGRRFQ